MIAKLLRWIGFEAGLGVIVYAVWLIFGMPAGLIVLGLFLVLLSLMLEGGELDVKGSMARGFGWLSKILDKPELPEGMHPED